MGAYVRAYLKRPAAGIFSSAMILLALPAEAHHPGGGGNTGSGGPINTISADTLSEGLIAASVRYEFIRLGQLSDADLIAAANRGTHAHSIRSIDAVSLSVAYGITNDFTVGVRAAGVRRSDIREPAEDMLSGGHMGIMNANDISGLMSPDGVNRRGNSAGFGDVTMLGQYRFHNNAQTGTSAAVLFGFKAPTGSTNQRDAFGNLFEAEFQPGSGSWDGLIGAAFTKRTGRWSFDVSGLYYLITNGSQNTNLGDRFLFGAAVSYRLVGASGSSKEVELHEYCMQPRNQLQEHCLYHANHDHSDMMKTPYTLDLVLELNGEWHDKQRIAGIPDPNSGGTTVYLSPGLRVGFDRYSGFISVGVPVLNEHNGVQSKPEFRVLTGIGARLN
jgi:outer membrane putative beta-barrel porin/alpha-amylase